MVILYDANEARYDHRANVAIGRKSSGRSAVQAFRAYWIAARKSGFSPWHFFDVSVIEYKS